jgi:exodeoxyribonuclease VII large subunit
MPEKLSLTELQLIIRDSLYMALPDMYWVVAEISEIKENSAGHCYLELIEKHPDEKNVRARVKAIIWSKRYRFLKSFFENATGESLKEGLNILIKIKVEYHELYGLSLIITDIDPAFTIGEMSMKRQLIIKKLEQEGVFSMNKELDIPVAPQRIAIISSKNAAGYTDFIDHLIRNNFGYVFYTALFESAMQGTETESGIVEALNRIADHSHLFDLVVIIRGGGSQSDLSWFDNYNIAYHITQFPLPLITGIGHEKDMSVTDLVANTSLKTPTAVADFLINRVTSAEDHLNEMSTEIKSISTGIIEKNKYRIESAGIKLLPISRILLAGIKDELSGRIMELINSGKEQTFRAGLIPATLRARLLSTVKIFLSGNETAIQRKKQMIVSGTLTSINQNGIRLKGLENTLNVLKPENVLLRGYTITSVNGKVLKSVGQINAEDIIDTQFIDGSVRSRVVKRKS